jgi:hypothetical protein
MAYYFECKDCGKKETFPKRKMYDESKEGKKQEYETVLCISCVSNKVRLKGNLIII